MEKKENRITPQQIYVSRLRQKMVEKDANVWEMVTVDKTPPPTGNEDMDRVAQVLATSKKITADRIYALFESDPLPSCWNIECWRFASSWPVRT